MQIFSHEVEEETSNTFDRHFAIMVVTLSERFEIALSDPGEFYFSGCKYCACQQHQQQQQHQIIDCLSSMLQQT